MPETLTELREAVGDWCAERSWIPRAPLLAWMAYLALRHLLDVDYTSILGALNLGIHEAGHLLFGWLPGEFLMVAGGTILQLAAPLASAWMFARQPDYFAVSFSGTWLATNLYNVATYMADARELDLPLVSVGGGEADHDWNFMLSALHLLDWDTRLAGVVRVLAFVLAWSSVAAGGWMLRLMATRSRRSL
jgi:hypothetical protein